MAVAIEAFSVVVLSVRADEKYPGGSITLREKTPNGRTLSDDHLLRFAFMSETDARQFAKELTDSGLDMHGGDPDVVIVSEIDESVSPYCEWIRVAKIQKGVIAWLEGTNPEKVLANEGWSFENGSGLQFSKEGDLKFLRLEGNVAVYWHKEQEREVYIGRTKPTDDEVYREASKVILNHMRHPGSAPLSGTSAEEVRQAIDQLALIEKEHPNVWNLLWVLAKGHSALGDKHRAYELFRRAYDLEKENESVPRELAGVCLELGRAEEAVTINEKAAALMPDNGQTLGNLACAYLFAGRLAEARTTIDAALRILPDDRTNRQLSSIIEQVHSGQRPQPTKLGDLSKQPEKQTPKPTPISLWRHLLNWVSGS